ncbi:MAG: 16S rRNA pseudouridine(516) synthase, partial [Bacteroidales bacterium]|nr:16S rRNA pseudouridine(516) synthase [Bacteroidales bacterium]
MTNHRHFILNKPYGYISQFVDNSCERKCLLGELYDFPKGAMAIGRLDKDSEGLLFVTTDGKLGNYIRSRHIEKEYYASV